MIGGNATKGKDYTIYAEQVQFNPDQEESFFTISLINDDHFEKHEQIVIALGDLHQTAVELPSIVKINIFDPDDGKLGTVLYKSHDNHNFPLCDYYLIFCRTNFKFCSASL